MCSVDPDEITEMERVTETLQINSENVVCRKCGESNVEVVLRLKEPYCRSCYLSYFVHKFRSAIGKSKMIKAGDQVLVAVSSGLSSAAMVHLIKDGISDQSVKRLRFLPTFLYIDESCLLNEDEQDVNSVCDVIGNYGLKCYITHMESIMDTSHLNVRLYDQDTNSGSCSTSDMNDRDRGKIKELLKNCSSSSSRQDLIYRLKLQLICSVAEKLKFTKVFLGDNASVSAVRILSNIAQGRGSHIASDVHFKSIYGSVEVYRPLREILEDEIEHYTRLSSISYFRPSLEVTEINISACTKKFVHDLQKDFPSTIPTIFRTGDKLSSGNTEIKVQNCGLCGNILDTNQNEASALYATILSDRLSKLSKYDKENEAVDRCSTQIETCKTGRCACLNSESKDVSLSEIKKSLCYSCRIIFKDLKSHQYLPRNILNELTLQSQRAKMKEEIQEFLINDSE